MATLSYTTVGNVSPAIIGRKVMVNGILFGGLSGYRKGIFRTKLFAGGNIHVIRNSAHIVY